MPEHRVHSGHGPVPPGSLAVRINGSDPTFELRTDRLQVSYTGTLDPHLLDLLDIAATVFAADGRVARGALTQAGLGEEWRRRFHFTVEVRMPAFWSRPEVTGALSATVAFLTGDEVSFRFVEATAPLGQQDYLDLHGGTHGAFSADRVLLFSGGLDSLSGAVEALTTTEDRILLVTHRSAPKMMPHQKRLAEALRKRFPGRLLWVPVNATQKGAKTQDRTQRSRTLLFGAMAFVAARISGARRAEFCENGVVSVNLPINGAVIGTLATRTTHPLGLRMLQALLDLIPGGPVAIANPYAGLTRAEVLGRLAAGGGANLIGDSVSCSATMEATIPHPHCGACSQCLDRRFGLLAAGLAAHDPGDGYATDVLLGPHADERDRVMVLDWARHALAFAGMTDLEFVQRFSGELARIVDAEPGRPAHEVLRQAIELHRRHGTAVLRVLEATLAAQASELLGRRLPPTSLLCMLAAELACDPQPLADLARPTPAPEIGAALERVHEDSAEARGLTIEWHQGHQGFAVVGLGDVIGPHVRVVRALQPELEADLASGLHADLHRFVPVGTLADRNGVTKQVVQQDVRRCRKELAEFWEAALSAPAPADPLIQNRPQKGYRLDPVTRFYSSVRP